MYREQGGSVKAAKEDTEMTRIEFLEKLKAALENELSSRLVQENVEYYNSYITDEMNKGRVEEAVTQEIGDPWVIARSLIEAEESRAGTQSAYSSGNDTVRSRTTEEQRQRVPKGSGSIWMLNTWWKKLLLALAVAGVIIVVVTVIGGIFSLLMPILVPVVLVLLVVRLLRSTRR